MSSDNNKTKLSRRAFLKNVGAGAAAMVAAHLAGEIQPASADTENGWGILIDLTRCVGCNSCALACKETNNMPDADIEPTKLSSKALTFVEPHEVTTISGDAKKRYVKRQCMHCLNASCASACPVGAMYKSDEGPIVYRAERCMGCRYCQLACPFAIPSFEWDNGITPVISKCWMCHDRLQEGLKPACVEACPTGTLRVGRRDELLAQAHAQIESNPGRYVDHIFGEFEVGGTSMLYLSDTPFEELGFLVDVPLTAPPEQTRKVTNTLPFALTGVMALMAGTAAYTNRTSEKTDKQEDKEQAEAPAATEDNENKNKV